MNIDLLLEYYEQDKALTELKKEIASDPVISEYGKHRQAWKEAQDMAIKINRDSEDLIIQVNGLTSQYEALLKDINETEQNLQHVEDINEADFYIRKLEKLSSNLQALAQDISALCSKVSDIQNQYRSTLSRGSQEQGKMKELEDNAKSAQARFQPRLKAQMAKIDEIKKRCGEEELNEISHFDILKKNKKRPIVMANENYCGWCSQEFPSSELAKLAERSWIHCPNCSVFVYIKK